MVVVVVVALSILIEAKAFVARRTHHVSFISMRTRGAEAQIAIHLSASTFTARQPHHDSLVVHQRRFLQLSALSARCYSKVFIRLTDRTLWSRIKLMGSRQQV